MNKLIEYQYKRLVKRAFKQIFKERNIVDTNKRIPIITVSSIQPLKVVINLRDVCSFEEFEKNINYIKTYFKANEVFYELVNGLVELTIYFDPLPIRKYNTVILNPYKLLLGYNYENNIIVDMKITPHVLIAGLSGQGKTYMAKTIIKNLEGLADVILINAFKDDFKDYEGHLILEEGNILLNLKILLESKIKRNRPVYLIIDELLTLTRNKEINKCITELLAVARHYNIFIIGITQDGTKEAVKFKHLFNTRVCFRLIDEASYRVVLGCSVDNDLNKQEFYCYSTNLIKGRTFEL